MENWRGGEGVYAPPSSNLSAFALPFTAPRLFRLPNLMPHIDSSEVPGVVPFNSEHGSWDGPSITGLSANWYLSSNHEVDPAMPPFANYYPFSGVKTSGEMNGQLFSWDLPVGVASTDYVVSHLGSLGKDNDVGPSHASYSLLGGAGNDSLMTANHPGFGGSSASKPAIGKSEKSFSDYHVQVFSSNSDVCDDRLDKTAAQYPPETAQIDGSCQLEEGNLALQHTAGTGNRKDVWSDEWGGPAFKYPRENVRIDEAICLVEGQLPPQRLTGTSHEGDPWNERWGGQAVVECPLKSSQVIREEFQHQASHPELVSDIWKQQTLLTPLWEQSTWCNGFNTDYENLVMKSTSVPATGSQPDASTISIGQVTQNSGNSEIGGYGEIFADLMPFRVMKSHPLLVTETELQFDAAYPRIQPDTKTFRNLYVSGDGLPKDKFPSKNLFNNTHQSSSSCGFSSLCMDNSGKAGSSLSNLAYDLTTSNPWSFHHSDEGTDSHFLDKAPMPIGSFGQPGCDGFYSQDIPIQSGSCPPSQTNRTEYQNLEISVKDSGSFFKQPAIFYASDGEKGFDGTVEAGSSWSKELQSPHCSGQATSTEPNVLRLSSHNVDLNSCLPPSQKLNEDERTPCKMHRPCGNIVAVSEMIIGNSADVVAEVSSSSSQMIIGNSADVVAEVSRSVLSKDNSDFSFSVHSSQDPIEKEMSESIPKVDLQAMVLTLHNLSELLYYYTSTGKCDVRKEDHHLLEKVIHNLVACSSKDVVLTANEEELKNSEVNAQLRMGLLVDHFIGDNEPVKSMPDGEENNSGMLSSGVDPQVMKDHYSTQQRTDEGKFSSEIFISGVNSVKDDNVIQAIKEVLSQCCDDGHEPDPEVHFFRNLWLEAEAELCSQNCKVRFNRLKSKLDASGIKDSSDATSAVERPKALATSVNFITEDVFPDTRTLEQSNNSIGSTRSCNYIKVGVSDIMARFNILKGESCDPKLRKDPTGEEQLPEGAPSPLILAKDTESDILTETAGISHCVSCSSVLIDRTCCEDSIDDAVMTRFNILMQWDENPSFKPENSVSVEAVVGRFEEKMCSTAGELRAHNKSEALTSNFFKHAESLPPCISDSSVMSRWNILKQRDENVGSIDNIVYREMIEVVRREEPVDGHEARETVCLYPDIMHNYNTLTWSGCGKQGTDSMFNGLKILKQRDGNQSFTENNLVLQESVDLGAAIRGDYLSTFSERSSEGSIAKAKYALQKESSSLADDTATLDCSLGGENSAIGSQLKGKDSGCWFDVTSSDWEHV